MAGYTIAHREVLKAAIASGTLEVETPDSGRVRYRTLSELREALTLVETELANQEAGQNGIRRPRPLRRLVVNGRSGF